MLVHRSIREVHARARERIQFTPREDDFVRPLRGSAIWAAKSVADALKGMVSAQGGRCVPGGSGLCRRRVTIALCRQRLVASADPQLALLSTEKKTQYPSN